MLLRFSSGRPCSAPTSAAARSRFLAPLGLFAGFVDATGGGGWGPVATPTLISVRPDRRRARSIGSVDTSEFLVAVAASLGFFIGIGSEGIACARRWPCWPAGWWPPRSPRTWSGHPGPAARLAGRRLIVLTNTRTILRALDVSTNWRTTVDAFVVGLWIAAVALAISRSRSAPLEVAGEPTTDQPTAQEQREEARQDTA